MSYSILNKQIFTSKNFSIVPIRFVDRFEIMKWRNEQIYHLRQNEILTEEIQEKYFKEIIASLFESKYPKQILFSFLENEICIGYGGLVHVNWIDKNAEISFIMNTRLENDFFDRNWSIFLGLIQEVAFNQLNLYKIFTFAFDVRPQLYSILEKNGFKKEALLQNHCLFKNKFRDVIIHSKQNQEYLFLREADTNDINVYYQWLNDPIVRQNSFHSNYVSFEMHQEWFNLRINDENFLFLIFSTNDDQLVGQVRFNKNQDSKAVISLSIDKYFRGKKLSTRILQLAVEYFFKKNPDFERINAFIKSDNEASKRAFLNAGFLFEEMVVYENIHSYKLSIGNENRKA